MHHVLYIVCVHDAIQHVQCVCVCVCDVVQWKMGIIWKGLGYVCNGTCTVYVCVCDVVMSLYTYKGRWALYGKVCASAVCIPRG